MSKQQGKFVSITNDIDNELKRHTVGLIQLQDFKQIKKQLKQTGQVKIKKEKKEITQSSSRLLSFDEIDQDEQDETNESNQPFKKIKKDPKVDTTFLPDKDREALIIIEKDRLEMEWVEKQNQFKKEEIVVSFIYWDGTGHPPTGITKIRKGASIREFLDLVKKHWRETRTSNTDNLVFIKEDLIIPHSHSFYDFIANKTRGKRYGLFKIYYKKSGPMWDFEVKDDVRLINDATIEVEEIHPVKICLKSWYDKNKHIYPANRWEAFHPLKNYGKYQK